MLTSSPIVRLLLLVLTVVCWLEGNTQQSAPAFWHGIERSLRYTPEGEAFVINNGERRFNRALYGGYSGFRVEAGDLPEFALYRPRLAGTLRLGLLTENGSKWLIDAVRIKATYDPGQMRYEVKDELLGTTTLLVEVLALHQQEGLIFRFRSEQPLKQVKLLLAFGGASDERFSREGDIGADPESVFYLEPDHCVGNTYALSGNSFELDYPAQKWEGSDSIKSLSGIFPPASNLRLADASYQDTPLQLVQSAAAEHPLVTGQPVLGGDWQYGLILCSAGTSLNYSDLPALFQEADDQRKAIAQRVHIQTPDPYINTLGGALAIASDAIWEEPAYHHGAIAWRQQLVGWRGAYVADPLGWHQRARTHFGAYAKSQLTAPASGPVTPDSSRNLARQVEEIGTAIFTEGYISRYPGGERLRAHHYDMNQVYIDALFRHFAWTGDLEFAREMWPLIKRHLAWEKRCFDTDGDALYDAYCSIWASDAVQYSGGGVTHASSYHYYANTQAAKLAELIGEDPIPYQKEASRIKTALNEKLWLADKGCFAEYQDLLGLQLLHDAPALWTVYHAMDSEVPEPLQAHQMLDYVQREIPRIPIHAHGLVDTNLYTVSTTNWLPYTWSVNNVALAEVMHTSLAFWQGGRSEEAFLLWKSALMESMYLGASPGSIQQLSFYDAKRGELYRDFADPIGMTARSLVEGLFGIRPNLLNGTLTITPGFPQDWEQAAIELPDLAFAYERNHTSDFYRIDAKIETPLKLQFQITPRRQIEEVLVNGLGTPWQVIPQHVGNPFVKIEVDQQQQFDIEIRYQASSWETIAIEEQAIAGQAFSLSTQGLNILQIADPQSLWDNITHQKNTLSGTLADKTGEHTFFIQVEQDETQWWVPIPLTILPQIALASEKTTTRDSSYWQVSNNTGQTQHLMIYQGPGTSKRLAEFTLPAGEKRQLVYPKAHWSTGTQQLHLITRSGLTAAAQTIDWEGKMPTSTHFDQLDLGAHFNASVNTIFAPQYWSPRPTGPTVQLPVTGIGNWCYPNVVAEIDDRGLRALAGDDQMVELPQGIPFAVSNQKEPDNILFTSQWDRFPTEIKIPLRGKAEHLYLLMAGSTNPMQSRMDNGVVEVTYQDGSQSTLALRNPDNWVPIEQDYYFDGYAFHSDQPPPPRIHLKTGLMPKDFEDYFTIKGFTDTAIEGGAATVLDLPLDPDKTLKTLTIRTLTNDVIIGLMAATLKRKD
ncbi:DUF4450 domain-containing protein [Lewinella sp. LCG006]|uniref:DUF4450 domain-containing protein n=1 Tax=Lewinella sp. LCG006 TaxID=3231911 RepID=UPI00345FBF1A